MASSRKKAAPVASTELVPTGESSPYLALRTDADELTELIQANIGGGDVDASLLDRVGMPSGGGTNWEVPTVDNPDGESMKEITGVILHMGNARVFFKDKYGEGEAGASPDCRSEDGLTGIPNPESELTFPTTDCAACPFNAFGTGHNGRSKACTEKRLIFILPEDSIIPIVVHVTPGSLRVMSQYFMRLLRVGKRPQDVVTSLALEKDENKDSIKFSKVKPSKAADLAPDAAQRMRSLAHDLEPVFVREVTVNTSADFDSDAVEA